VKFEEQARLILRFQNKKQVDDFLFICKKPLGLHEWSEDEIQDVVERHYLESLSGGVPKDMAYKSAMEVEIRLNLYNKKIPASHYKPSGSLNLKEQKRALRYLNALEKLQTKRKVEGLCLNLNSVQNSIKFIEESLKVNELMNTGGKPTIISDQDLSKLVNLKNLYTVCFPENSHSYKLGSLLNRLGKILIGKSIPRNIERLIDKAVAYMRNLEE